MLKVVMVEVLSPEFVAYCNEINRHLAFMVMAIVRTIKQVSPQTFAHELRVFWEPVEIGGHQYDGAGAAQLPICIIDQFFWASDRGDRLYKSYEERYKSDPTVVGSSGHRPEILPHIVELTRNARAYVMEQYNRQSRDMSVV